MLVEMALAVVVVVWFCWLPWSRRHAVAAIPTGIALSICLLATLNIASNVLAVAVWQIVRKDT